MNLGIVTVNRPINYLNYLLSSIAEELRPQLLLEFFVGTPSYQYLTDIMFERLKEPSWDGCHYTISNLPATVLANHGTHTNSVVNHAIAYLNCNVVVEDDVLLSSQFQSRLTAAIDECYHCRPNGHFLLSLSSQQLWPRGSIVVPYPLEVYVGTMGMYIPPELQFDVFRFMTSGLGTSDCSSPDIALAAYCRKQGIPMYCTTESIVKHIGIESSISDREVRVETPSFVE